MAPYYQLFNDDKGVLNKLLEALKEKVNKKEPKEIDISIPEVNHLSEFPIDELSVQGFSPRWIIESMMASHACTQQYVALNPNAAAKFSYVYLNKKDSKLYEYTFTNTMEFYIDVYTLCHLYFLISRCGLRKWPSVMELMKIMEKKYGIRNIELMTNPNAEIITLSRIAHSYPSITMEIFRDSICSTAFFLSTLFPNLNILPYVICSPIIVSLLPSSDDSPIAVLIAIHLLLENHSGLRKSTPLTTIYLNILRAYKSTVFPESLKYELCWKWGIICAENNKYLPSFALCRKIAKNLITEMRPEESSLKLLLPLL